MNLETWHGPRDLNSFKFHCEPQKHTHKHAHTNFEITSTTHEAVHDARNRMLQNFAHRFATLSATFPLRACLVCAEWKAVCAENCKHVFICLVVITYEVRGRTEVLRGRAAAQLRGNVACRWTVTTPVHLFDRCNLVALFLLYLQLLSCNRTTDVSLWTLPACVWVLVRLGVGIFVRCQTGARVDTKKLDLSPFRCYMKFKVLTKNKTRYWQIDGKQNME